MYVEHVSNGHAVLMFSGEVTQTVIEWLLSCIGLSHLNYMH